MAAAPWEEFSATATAAPEEDGPWKEFSPEPWKEFQNPNNVPMAESGITPTPQRDISGAYSAPPAPLVPEPKSNPVMDALRRVPAGIASASAIAGQGLAYATDVLGNAINYSETLLPQGAPYDDGSTGLTPVMPVGEATEDVRGAMRDIQERSASDYGVDPARDKEIVSRVIQGASSVVPIIASGPLAPVTGGALMGESVRQEAEAKGATPNQQAAAFGLGAAAGVVSEALLGLPALLRSARASGAGADTIQGLARQAVTQAFKSAGREGAQEAIDQISQNLIANTLVGYDKTRGTFEGVPEAAGIGALVGGPLGAVVQTAASLDQRQPASEAPIVPVIEPLVEAAAREADPVAPMTAEALRETPPIEVPFTPISGSLGPPEPLIEAPTQERPAEAPETDTPITERLPQELSSVWPDLSPREVDAALSGPFTDRIRAKYDKLTTEKKASVDEWFDRNQDASAKYVDAKWFTARTGELSRFAQDGDAVQFSERLTDGLREINQRYSVKDRPAAATQLFEQAGEIAKQHGLNPDVIRKSVRGEMSKIYGSDAPEMTQALFGGITKEAVQQATSSAELARMAEQAGVPAENVQRALESTGVDGLRQEIIAKLEKPAEPISETPSPETPKVAPSAGEQGATAGGALTTEQVRDQSARVEGIVTDAVNSGRDRIEAENEAMRVVTEANKKGVPIDWGMVRTQAFRKPTQKRGGGQTESMEAGERPLEETAAATDMTPDEQARVSDMRKVAAEMVAKLPKGEQDVMRLSLEGRSVSEIAAETGMTERSVSTTKIKALRKMQKSVYALGISPDNKFAKWFADNAKRLFTAEGNLPVETFNRWMQRTGQVKAESRKIAYATRDLYAALRKEFGISRADEFVSGFEKVPKDFVNHMNEALLGKRDINSLPESVREPLQRMRDHIDALSAQMIRDGIVSGKLEAVIVDNMGVYMTRSYRVFDDPKWAEKIPVEVRNRTRDFILNDLRRDDPSATPEQANAVMQAMLQDWKDQGSGVLIKGGKLGSKDLSSFIARKDIPKVLRDFMGEYNDPVINYARSVSKMAHLIGNQHFLNDIRSQGMGTFLFEDGTQPATHSALIAAEESDVMSPLNGLRTTPEIAEAFRNFGKSDASKSAWIRFLLKLNGIAKAGKTVGSVMTQARNLFSQPIFWLANGHFDVSPVSGAGKSVLADIGATDSKTSREAYGRYLRLGIVDQSTPAGELRDVIRDAGLNDADVDRLDIQGHVLGSVKKYTIDAAARAYQISDDLGKIVGFENELARQKKIHPGKSEAHLEKESAERIRNTYPSYSMVPEAVKQFRKQPVIGPFVSFAYESFRTEYHNLRYMAEDLGSTNPEQRKAGIQRLAGQIAILGGGYVLSTVSRAMLGLSASDEDDLRRFLPKWDKNAQLVFTGTDEGKATYVNLSYANPYSYMTDPIVAVATGVRNGEEIMGLMAKAFSELLKPFTSEDILADALLDIKRNTTSTGRQVYNPQDTPDEKTRAMLAHVMEALEPGTATRLRKKIIPSIMGKQTPFGTALSPTNEMVSELTGFKTQTLDYEQALAFKSYKFKNDDTDAENIFRSVATRRGEVSPDDISDSYKRSNRAKFGIWKDMYGDIQAAKRRGVSETEIRQTLDAGGIPNKDIGELLSGKFSPYTISSQVSEKLRRLNRALPSSVSEESQRSRALQLSGSFQP